MNFKTPMPRADASQCSADSLSAVSQAGSLLRKVTPRRLSVGGTADSLSALLRLGIKTKV